VTVSIGWLGVLVIPSVISLVVLLVLSAFFSGSEAALFSLNPTQVRRVHASHPGTADRIERLLASPSRLLCGILVGNTLVNVAASGVGYAVVEALLPQHGVLIAVPLMTVLLLVFGEVSPKRLALHMPERLATVVAAPLEMVLGLMRPFTAAATAVSRSLDRTSVEAAAPAITEGEFRTALLEGEGHGLLDAEERTMLEGIIRLEGLTAADVMTPRVDLVAIDEDADPAAAESIARRARFRHLPVWRGTLDQVQGFLDVRRFLLSEDRDIGNARAPALFVPEATPLDSLMVTLESRKRRVACVTDEFGGTAGIVTVGDIMGEIIADSSASGHCGPGIESLEEGRWLVGGDTSLEEVNFELGLRLEAEAASRLGGWLAAQLERIPRRGDVVERQGIRAVVRSVRNRRVLSVVLERTD